MASANFLFFARQPLAQRDLSFALPLAFDLAFAHELTCFLRIALLLTVQVDTRSDALVVVKASVGGGVHLLR